VHDWIMSWAGSERVVAEMLEVFPQADFVVGTMASSVRDLNAVTRRARETWLARLPGARTHHRWFLPLEGVAFRTFDTRGYDVIISSSHAFAKMVRRPANAVHICYCYSPPRYLWDLAATYRRGASSAQRVLLGLGSGALRGWDRRSALSIDAFIAISSYIAQRIARCYGRVANVVYPPVAPKPTTQPNPGRGDFLLHLGRLVPYKRVDLAIAAAERLGIRLLVAGDGPDRKRLQRLAGRYTEFVGTISEAEAGALMSSCAAFVFCAEEDFGIAPVEANAHGAPVIGYGRGGLLETMIPGQTAELFEKPEVDHVVAAIERALARTWSEADLRANARRFAPDRFRARFLAEVVDALPARFLEQR
jgi:glycosyltransferase involved in cell wall biosynthesis